MNNKKTGIFGGVIAGLILLVVGTGLLWWNEGNNVKNIKTVDEVSKNVIDISSDEIDEQYNGKLVATNGKLVVEDEAIKDTVFGISVKSPLLYRIVEVYQWEEREETDDNNTTYSYNKVWSEDIIDSSSYNNKSYQNPTSKPYNNEYFAAEDCKVGKYNLSSSQIESLATEKYAALDNAIVPENYVINGNYITNSKDINNPQIGDVRISMMYNGWTEASVLAVVNGHSFSSYISQVGKSVNEVRKGILTSKEIIKMMQDENNMLKWILRLVGTILLICAYLSIISPITKLASYVPILGGIVGGIVGVIAFLIGLVHSLVVIAIAWIRFRPLLGIVLLAVVAILVFFIVKLIKNKKSQKTAEVKE